jgi:hypothetical protein
MAKVVHKNVNQGHYKKDDFQVNERKKVAFNDL